MTTTKTEHFDYLRELKHRSLINTAIIEHLRVSLTSLLRERDEMWREAVLGHNVPQSTCARYSEVTDMVVSRAMKDPA